MPIQIAIVAKFESLKKCHKNPVIIAEVIKIPLIFKKNPFIIASNILLGGLSASELALQKSRVKFSMYVT